MILCCKIWPATDIPRPAMRMHVNNKRLCHFQNMHVIIWDMSVAKLSRRGGPCSSSRQAAGGRRDGCANGCVGGREHRSCGMRRRKDWRVVAGPFGTLRVLNSTLAHFLPYPEEETHTCGHTHTHTHGETRALEMERGKREEERGC